MNPYEPIDFVPPQKTLKPLRQRLSDWCDDMADSIDLYSIDMPWQIGVPYALALMPVYMTLFILACLLDIDQ